MKRKLTLLLTAFLLLTGMTSWGQLRSTITDQLDRELTGVTGTTYTSWEGKTSNSEAVYAGQSAGGNESIQLRSNNSNSGIITTESGGTVTNVTVTWNENTANGRTLNVYGSHTAYTSPTELYDAATQGTLLGTIVNGTSTELEITDSYEFLGLRSNSGAMYLTQIDITWEAEGGVPPTPTVAAPTFTPAAGTYYEAQTVSITCTTEDATIYYSLNSESGPWMVFASPLTINETTTICAYAVKEGYNDSPVVCADYTISDAPGVITIAEARALANNEYALVQGVVTFIDGRNVYIQDATAGIDLFLNSNTVPSTLALGDLVQAYGKRATYNGLAELSNINGNDTEQFSILSSGNTLPLVVKTIAEIIEGGADALQCTRVKVEGATIGAINTNSNTPLTQDGSTINIYKVPALTGIEEGDVVDVISVVGYFNVPQLRVALASDVVLSETPVIPDPQLTVSTNLLDDFRYIVGSGPSMPKSFTLSGSNLVEDVTLTAPQNYELSLSPDNGYFDSDELSPVDGILAETTIYVRLKAGLEVGTYSGDLTIVSGTLSHSITLNGSVDEMPIVTIPIAEARTLANGQFAQVEGTVIFLDGRNVYIQDETAGIDLYLNSNTVPTGLAVGDIVRAYGSKTVYKGLVELTGINGGNADEFVVLSHNNVLPLAVKTIAEINSDFSGSNLLQSTRVKIEGAIIGAINPSGTTVITQDGNSLNIYLMPVVEGLIEGDEVTVIGVIGCYNTPQLRIASAADVLFGHRPTLTASPSSLSGFTYEYTEGGPSDIAYFELSGNYLMDNVAVLPSESFEVTTQPEELFHPENPAMVYIPESGVFYGIKIYVRMKAGLEVGTYTEQLAAVSNGADTLFIHVTGTVTGEGPTPPTPPDPPTPSGDYFRISSLSQLAEGNLVVFAARFDDNAADYYAMSNTSSGKPTGVLFSSVTSGSDEVLPVTIVDEEANFYWVVGVTDNGYTFTNAVGEQIGYSASTNFATNGDNTEWTIELSTAGDEAMVPGYTGFLINNVNYPVRYFALNSNHNYGAYHTNNINNSGYNFYLDIFVKTEGGVPPTPTVATPTFNPVGGTYFETQTVSIACSTEGATIYYSTVSANGPWTAYQNAITVDESMTFWAYAAKEGYNDSNVAEATYIIQVGVVTIFNQDWEGEMNGWTFVDVEGEMSWTVAQYSGNHYAYANGYNHGANIDWCISPAFNLNTIGNPVLSFRTAKNYTGPDLEVFFSNDYDGEHPATATWTPLTCALSSGSWTWTESGDISLGSFSGTNCYIGFKYTCEESSAAGWEVDDIMLVGQTSDPVVTVTPLALSGFTYVEGNGPSDEQSFTVSGFNLSGNITITAPSDYEISETSGSGFTQSPITLAPVGGNVEETTIYVRLKAGLAVGTYNDEDITVSCADVDDIDVTCNGNVTAQPVPGDDYVRISDAGQLVAGNRVILAARYNETTDAYVAIQNTLTGGKLATTEFTSVMNGTDEIIPIEIISIEDDYYWTIGITDDGYTFTNAGGDVIGYNTSTNFNMNGEKTDWTITAGTSGEGAMVPNYYGFNIINVITDNRAFALNANHVCGAYHTQNLTSADYNFFLDIFMQGEGGTCTVAAPTFDPAGGTYYEPQNVTISCATEGATIWYSLISGNGPWTPYTEAITVEEFASIWAYAEKEGCNDSPVVNAGYIIQDDLVIIFNQDWEDDWNGWTEVCVYGDSLWRIASYQGNHYAYANGYNHPASEDWLISPAFDLDSYSDVVLTFLTAKNYTGPELEVYFSNDYDGQNPITATWEPLDCELSQGSWNWVPSGDISLDDFSGTNCYIGFRYTCTDDEAAGWEVDDIMLVSGSATPTPTLTATPNIINGLDYTEGEGPSTSQNYTLTGANLEGEGNITLTVNEYFEILQDDGSYDHTLQIPYANGQLENQPVTIYVRLVEGLEVGTYTDTITHEGGGAYTEVILNGTVHSENEPSIAWGDLPHYIQGNNGSNNNRVPVATYVRLQNLEPYTTYRYTNQFVDENDGLETAGAGNVIYANLDGFYRTTSPSLATEGGYGEFTTNWDGEADVWFVNEPTANARFTPGNHVYLRIRLNDGHDGTTVAHTFTTESYATVINFGTEHDANQGTAFYVKSNENPMTFAQMFTGYLDPQNPDTRPIFATIVETTGVDFGNINQYADFYKEEVAGKDGWFGGILPNDNEYGINKILVFDITHYWFQDYYTAEFNGQWAPEAYTVNPSAGLDEPIFIDLTDDGVEEDMATNVKVWNADHEFVIENGDNAHYSMTVYNVLGQPMMMKQVNAGSTECISHSLASGVYVIRLQNNQSSVSVKVIVR